LNYFYRYLYKLFYNDRNNHTTPPIHYDIHNLQNDGNNFKHNTIIKFKLNILYINISNKIDGHIFGDVSVNKNDINNIRTLYFRFF